MLPRPFIIAGPTASGKTDLALALAKQLDGEIISADSRQIYKGLNNGTACPKGIWKNNNFYVEGIKYHLADFLPIDKKFDVSLFCKAVGKIEETSKKPLIFAGGTGLYLQTYFCGMDKLPKADETLRKSLAKKTKAELYAELEKLDPKSAKTIPQGNIHRVIRALEITILTGKQASTLRKQTSAPQIPASRALFLYINWDRELLNKRIIKRTNLIFEPMIEEARQALKNFGLGAAGLNTLGYTQAIEVLQGKLTKKEALEKIIILTRQYAKRQRTWFRRYKNIISLDINKESDFDIPALCQKIIDLSKVI
ncbi:MAG: tRNA (adenosine(37)-N6)-dimethylallyltransferase MiaA [Elusimicrobiaceae bacterium]|nr:tRNA (adenosine(37)-N6)-dimethylallyltransferase MiaA [Elusimicrobiaceae bacterium]